MTILLGCIADDFTGATDLANNLVRAGMRVVQMIGVPDRPLDSPHRIDAVVIALKSRTVAPDEAVAQSLAALRWLRAQSAEQFYFKYCSTFDSIFTGDAGKRGNIGPVTDALMDALGCDFTIATPAFPDNLRTVFKGYLFIDDMLLSESGMKDHPLTPMTDANLVRVLQAQTAHKVGLIDHSVVAKGADAISQRIAQLRKDGVGIAVVDVVSNDDLLRLAPALKSLPLLTAGSGVAIGLPGNFGLKPSPQAAALPPATGLQAVVSGSCSTATNHQVADFIQRGLPALALNPLNVAAGRQTVAQVLDWAAPQLAAGPVLVYSTADPQALKATQGELGTEAAGMLMERTLAAIARGLVGLGVRQLLVAGGETSGACVQALGMAQLQIGGQIDPGVPWCYALADAAPAPGLPIAVHIALKSGNFGADDFFIRAFDALAQATPQQGAAA